MLEALLAHGALETLDLGANGLTGAGFEALLPGLAACSSLQTLEVSNVHRAVELLYASGSLSHLHFGGMMLNTRLQPFILWASRILSYSSWSISYVRSY